MRIHIHANCQSLALQGLLSEVRPNWEISHFEVHAEPIITEIERHYEYIRSADVVLCQPIHEHYRGRSDLSLKWLKDNVRSTGRLIVFPSMHFGAHQPTWEGGVHPAFDSLAAHLLSVGMRPDDVVNIMMSPTLLSDAEINAYIQVAINEADRREVDDAVDLKLTPFLRENGRHRQLFHIMNHPFRETSVYVANLVLEQLGVKDRLQSAGRDYQPNPHIPALPSVTRFLIARGGAYSKEIHDMVLLPNMVPMSLAQYYGAIVKSLSEMRPEDLIAAISRRWTAVRSLRMLAEGSSSLPGIQRWTGAVPS